MLVLYWVTDSNWILYSYKTHSISSCATEPFTSSLVEARHTCSTWHSVVRSHLFFFNWTLQLENCPNYCTQCHFAQMPSKNFLIHIKIASQPTCVLQQVLSLLINILIFSVCFLLNSKNFEVAVVVLFTSVIWSSFSPRILCTNTLYNL